MPETYKAPEDACPRCKRRGKTWPGQDPCCAFPGEKAIPPEWRHFQAHNWQCATLLALRDLVDDYGEKVTDRLKFHVLRTSREQNIATIDVSEVQWSSRTPPRSPTPDFLILGWYKSRGALEFAQVMCDRDVWPISLDDAEDILEHCGR